jgi:hypothetical protein
VLGDPDALVDVDVDVDEREERVERVERVERERADMVSPARITARPTPVIIDKNHHAPESSMSLTRGRMAIKVATSPMIVRIAPALITRCARAILGFLKVPGICSV